MVSEMDELQEALGAIEILLRNNREELKGNAWRNKTAKKAEMKAKLREAERYVSGRNGSPFVQGGLPSLGKRRP